METLFKKAPNAEALEIIASKPAVSRAAFDALLPELRNRVFLVTGLESANVMQTVRDQVAGLAKDQTWEEAKADIIDSLSPYLGDGAEQRATLLLRTHGFQAFQAGQWKTIQADDDTTHMQYLATEDDRVRDTHLALNGIILPKDDEFWDEHYPPWEFNCRCRVRAMNQDMVEDERHNDLRRNPEDKLVLTGAVAKRLREGTIVRDNRAYNVAPKEGTDAFRFHPDNLTIPLAELKARYDADVWEEFVKNARKTLLTEGNEGNEETLWDWLGK